MKKGFFISFEGCEGCGKDTQITLLKDYLEQTGCEVSVYDPKSTELGQMIREVILKQKEGRVPLSDFTSLLLFLADRRHSLETFIKPALTKGNIVIANRFYDSTVVYQGFAGNVPIDVVGDFIQKTTDLTPDLTILLDIDVKEGLKRKYLQNNQVLDNYEKRGFSFHEKIREGFLKLSKTNSNRIQVVNGNKDIEFIFSSILRIVNHKNKFTQGQRLDDKDGIYNLDTQLVGSILSKYNF